MDFKTIKGVQKIFIIITFLLLAAGFMLVVQPFFTQNQKFADEISVSKQEQDNVLGNLNKLKGYKDTIPAVEKIDEDTSKQFPSSADTPGLVAFVTGAANKAGLATSSIKTLTTGIPTLEASSAALTGAAPAPAAEGAAAPAAAPAPAPAAGAAPAPGASGGTSNLAKMDVTMTVTGSVAQLGAFMNNLTAPNQRNLLISSYAISTDGEKGESSLNITATTYIYKDVPTVSEAASAPAAPAAADGAAPVPSAPATTPAS
jgi:Tfp pilus assembly protein PilO